MPSTKTGIDAKNRAAADMAVSAGERGLRAAMTPKETPMKKLRKAGHRASVRVYGNFCKMSPSTGVVRL
jgi:hypothetical protein